MDGIFLFLGVNAVHSGSGAVWDGVLNLPAYEEGAPDPTLLSTSSRSVD